MDIDATSNTNDNTINNTSTTGTTETTSTTDNTLSFTKQLAKFISNEISQSDISGNFNILFDIDPHM